MSPMSFVTRWPTDFEMSSAPRTSAMPLRRVLGLPMLVFYGVGVTIGAGIFALIGEIVRIAGDQAPMAFLLAVLFEAVTGWSGDPMAAMAAIAMPRPISPPGGAAGLALTQTEEAEDDANDHNEADDIDDGIHDDSPCLGELQRIAGPLAATEEIRTRVRRTRAYAGAWARQSTTEPPVRRSTGAPSAPRSPHLGIGLGRTPRPTM